MTEHNLRSVLPRTSPRWFTRRTQWRQLGLDDEDLDKPKIAVVNSSSKLSPCFSHLDDIADRVVASIRQAGGVGFEIRTVAPTDFIMSAGRDGGHVLAGRDLLAHDIEAVVDGALLDGMICLASCDKTTPGQLMAAARTDVPTLIVSCGYQACGTMPDGEPVDIEEVFLRAGGLARGRIGFSELCEMSDRAIASPGVCAGMGTANTMHLVAEALGMTIPGYAPVAANSSRMFEAVDASGPVILEAVAAGRRPRRILTPAAIRNAVKAVLAVSGSLNAVKHLDAIAREAGAAVDVAEEFRRAAETIRPVTAVRPNGPRGIEEFVAAGGTLGVIDALGAEFDRSTSLVTGATWEDALAGWARPEGEVITDLASPQGDHATIRLLRGSLAPRLAIAKLSVVEKRPLTFRGPARVYDDAAEALEAITAGEIAEGSVLVLRGYGPVGRPGMGMASNVAFALDGAGMASRIAFVTDGQFSGLVNTGIVVGEVAPEGIGDAPLALVRDGDVIEIDIAAGRIDLAVDTAELADRAAAAGAPAPPEGRGWLEQFAAGYGARYATPVLTTATPSLDTTGAAT
ncbi:dihydroxy-acid dehydratase [Microbacterium sp. Marseille-Q6965]|uniref:dihydroxy-acid dehydratase n=1 Tax=Microbacterium sp. Marseille-Q6965 TaxID=2965072 RepID=UPI0021B776FC|nr:dihydroxy-acid dehydratase [Microbacterium sp. Marseille-Q6965]